MISIAIGPLALPVAPLIALVALITTLWVGEQRWWRSPAQARPDLGRVLWPALGVGLLAARLAFIATTPERYLQAPIDILNLRDGGLLILPGLGVSMLVVLGFAWRHASLRRPLLGGLSSGTFVWGALTALSALGTPEQLDALPWAKLRQLDQRPAELAALRSADPRPVVLNLWASWCPPCRREMPAFADAQLRHPEWRFILVNQGEDAATVQRFLGEHGLNFDTVLLDPISSFGPALGSAGLPTTVYFDAHGKLIDRHMGDLSGVALEHQLRTMHAHP
ncbi:MAG: prolipoprotein diacylglyceryl transferase family protein [Leptothrix ochracea]|uniref:prolipoprotein diacylglyceryl transferase family protein n=2 Tax=Leptothrix ochracea TaxID=735331 RepID=UPI0034E2615F